jgi:hypothetical protein
MIPIALVYLLFRGILKLWQKKGKNDHSKWVKNLQLNLWMPKFYIVSFVCMMGGRRILFSFQVKKRWFFSSSKFFHFFSLHYKSHLFTALGTTEWNSNLDSIEKRKITYKF